ncbi:hypothetical protein QR680_007092 [Steinernema hermaphroditum]|uniref:Uncharacterized protein n=1 Tax=Steinernema hermaphroditum TaxID=289476 RepID=A0AA39HZ49_9BILA|nr:hypothetical protein QR680_007092 [Steinernema hermaphroditum]
MSLSDSSSRSSSPENLPDASSVAARRFTDQYGFFLAVPFGSVAIRNDEVDLVETLLSAGARAQINYEQIADPSLGSTMAALQILHAYVFIAFRHQHDPRVTPDVEQRYNAVLQAILARTVDEYVEVMTTNRELTEMVHLSVAEKPPIWNIFHDRMISAMHESEINFYKEKLVTMVDQVSEESSELFIDRPRFVNAVVVVADETSPGELLKVSCIRQLDPVYEPVPPTERNGDIHEFKQHDYKSVNEYYDDDIEKALRQLQQSRDMLGKGETNGRTSMPSSPQKTPKKSLLEQDSPRLKSNLFSQFPSMNRKGLSTN